MNFRTELMKYLQRTEPTTDADLEAFVEDIIAPNQDKLPILYRFSPADYYNIRAFETQTLFLSEIGQMNDIFEGLSCAIDDKVISSIEKLSDVAYLKSFTETKDDLKMWSMYADSYAGMCIAYNFRECAQNFIYHLFPVCYSETRQAKPRLEKAAFELEKLKLDISETNALSECEAIRDIMSLFLTKSRDWENEQEWRVVVTYPQMNLFAHNLPNEESSFFYDIAERTIHVPYTTDVYLGPKMPELVKKHIREIADRLNIQVHEMQLDPQRYALVENAKIKSSQAEKSGGTE